MVQNFLKYLGSLRPTQEELEGLKAEYAHRLPPPKKRGRPRKGER